MCKLRMAVSFFAGVSIGGAAAWCCARKKYAGLAEQEINSVREAFARREQQLKAKRENMSTPAAIIRVPEKEDIETYARRVQGGKDHTPYLQTAGPDPAPDVEAPYVISPEEFGELDGYTQISLTYFDDGILSDENGVIIDDPEEIIGDGLNHFGEYEADSVFVRSDVRRCDYEILRDLRSYAEFRTTLPPKI